MRWVTFAAAAAVTLGACGCATVRAARDRLVQAPPVCVEQTVQVYFEPDVAAITPEGRAVIREAAAAARSCRVAAVQVVGLADAAGAPDENLALSRRRAQSVALALAEAGLPAAEFQVAAQGQAGALTSQGEAAPLRRRADITLKLAPR